MKINLKNMFIAPLALLSLSACVYSDGYGQNNLGYNDDQYCDPYNEYDAYYGCDLEYGFANFGYGGGWYQDYYYPGFGFFIFDNLGRRYRMNDYYLGYWGRKRQKYFQSRFSNRSYSGYRLRSFPWSERRGKRFVRGDRARASRRAERRENRRDDRFENRQDRRQARRDRREQNENRDNRQRSERRDRRSERRAARRSDSDGAGARERGRNGNAAQAGDRASQPPRSQPPRARPPQNRQERSRPPRQNNNPPRARNTENSKPPRARPLRVKQKRNSRPNRSGNRSRQQRRNFPKDD